MDQYVKMTVILQMKKYSVIDFYFWLVEQMSDVMAKDLRRLFDVEDHDVNIISSTLSLSGYFIHDFLDVAFNQPFKRSWEVLIHHSVVINRVCSQCVMCVEYLLFFDALSHS